MQVTIEVPSWFHAHYLNCELANVQYRWLCGQETYEKAGLGTPDDPVALETKAFLRTLNNIIKAVQKARTTMEKEALDVAFPQKEQPDGSRTPQP